MRQASQNCKWLHVLLKLLTYHNVQPVFWVEAKRKYIYRQITNCVYIVIAEVLLCNRVWRDCTAVQRFWMQFCDHCLSMITNLSSQPEQCDFSSSILHTHCWTGFSSNRKRNTWYASRKNDVLVILSTVNLCIFYCIYLMRIILYMKVCHVL